MDLKIKNVGMVNTAEIKIDGITVIAGDNNTGKSTIGKTLFLLFKGMSALNVNSYRSRKFTEKVNRAVNEYRYNVPIGNDNAWFYFNTIIYDDADFRKIINRMTLSDNVNNEKCLSDLRECMVKGLDKVVNRTSQNKEAQKKKYLTMIDNYISNIREALEFEIPIDKAVRDYFDILVSGIFGSDFETKACEEETVLTLNTDDVYVADIHYQNGDIQEFKYILDTGIKDITYVETPQILNYAELVNNALLESDMDGENSIFISRECFTDPISKDLVSKLMRNQSYNQGSSLDESIRHIIDGSVDYNLKSQRFIYNRNNVPIGIKNTAAGIKSFGILQILFDKGYLRSDTVLVLDEPEVNMHPKWQLEYAKLLIWISKNIGTKMVITSHSPYFIEAIDTFSKTSKINDKVSFYETRTERSLTKICLQSDINDIFESLNSPFIELEQAEIDNF